MDWRYLKERDQLLHTIAHLLSLAFMAHAVAFRSHRVRRNVIDIISLGEGAGLRLCARYGLWEGDTSKIVNGYSSDDAIALAVSLRTIAIYLRYQVDIFDRYTAAWQAWIEGYTLEGVAWLVIASAPLTSSAKVPLIDTS